MEALSSRVSAGRALEFRSFSRNLDWFLEVGPVRKCDGQTEVRNGQRGSRLHTHHFAPEIRPVEDFMRGN